MFEGDIILEDSQKNYMTDDNLRILNAFRLMDDDFMNLVFNENYEAVELLLNIILERNDIEVKRVEIQKEEKSPVIGGRSITLDIFAMDSTGKNYDIEVQRADRGAGFKRARIHSSALDSRIMKAGQDFEDVDDSYVVFITENDVVGLGLPMYHDERVILEDNRLANDGSHIIYVNGAYKNDEDPVGRLMHDFRCTSASDMFYDVLASQVRFFKETEGGQEQVCRMIEDERDKTRIALLFENIKNIMEETKWSLEKAMSVLKVSDKDRATLSKMF